MRYVVEGEGEEHIRQAVVARVYNCVIFRCNFFFFFLVCWDFAQRKSDDRVAHLCTCFGVLIPCESLCLAWMEKGKRIAFMGRREIRVRICALSYTYVCMMHECTGRFFVFLSCIRM